MFESYIEKMTKLIRLVLNLKNNELNNEDGIMITNNLVELNNLTELNLNLAANTQINNTGFEEILSNLNKLNEVNLELNLRLIDGIG